MTMNLKTAAVLGRALGAGDANLLMWHPHAVYCVAGIELGHIRGKVSLTPPTGTNTAPYWFDPGDKTQSPGGSLKQWTGSVYVYADQLPALSGGSSSTVANASSVAGATVSDALETLANSIGSYVLTVAPSGALTAASSGVTYTSGARTDSGGTTPYSYALVGGTLPPGITLNAVTGVLSGVPTTAGTFTWQVAIRDSRGVSRQITQSLTVTNGMVANVVAGALATTTVGTAASYTLSVIGGLAPYTYAISSGSLPAGMALNASTGVLSGTPTGAGSYTFNVRVTDSSSRVLDTAYLLAVRPVFATVQPAGYLTSATVNSLYGTTLTSSGGLAPYTYAVTGGSLPSGVVMSSAGVISGTPTTAQTVSFTVRRTDAEGRTLDTTYSVVVSSAAVAFTAGEASGNLATVAFGTAVSTTLTSSGGTSPYSYSIVAGALPTGVALGGGGVISGTANSAGTHSFTIRRTDAAAHTIDTQYTITVQAAVVLTPGQASGALTGGVTGTAYALTLTTTGGTSPYTYDIVSDALPNGLTLTNVGVISGTPSVVGTAAFTVRRTDAAARTLDTVYSIAVVAGVSLVPDQGAGALSSGTINAPYSNQLTTSYTGLAASPTYSVVAGTLPSGIYLTSAGLLSGTPTVSGTYSFTIRRLGSSASVDTAYTLTVSAVPGVFGIGDTLSLNGIGTLSDLINLNDLATDPNVSAATYTPFVVGTQTTITNAVVTSGANAWITVGFPRVGKNGGGAWGWLYKPSQIAPGVTNTSNGVNWGASGLYSTAQVTGMSGQVWKVLASTIVRAASFRIPTDPYGTPYPGEPWGIVETGLVNVTIQRVA